MEYLILALLGLILGGLLPRLKVVGKSKSYILAVILSEFFVVQIVTERVGYFDPFTPIFIVISLPVPLLSAWLSDAILESSLNGGGIKVSLRNQVGDLKKAAQIIYITVATLFVVLVSIALASA